MTVSLPKSLQRVREGLAFIELLAIVVGIIGGIGAVVFRLLISLDQSAFYSYLLPRLTFYADGINLGIILIPASGGLIVGYLVTKFATEARGHGVPEVMEAYALRGGRIRSRVAFVKVIASSITLGSGGSAGREGPIAQIGATAGSALGRFVKLDAADVRLLVVCGLSAGIAGTFNAPLGGALFGLEVLQGRFHLRGTIPVILSSVVGATVANVVFGLSPTIVAPAFRFSSISELALYLALGVAFGFISFAWVRVFYLFEDAFSKLRFSWKVKPVLGGALTGAIGMFFPLYGILGVGYNGVDMALMGGFSLAFLVLLGAAKIIATSLTIGSGNSGGVFSPSLYIGSMFGGAMGLTFVHFFPSLATQPFAYSLAGMGALFAGTARAPITSMIMIPEMTNDWNLLPPMMISCITSFYISSYLLRQSSIYTLKLERRGVDIKNFAIPDELKEVKVEDAMERRVIAIQDDTALSDFMSYPIKYGHTSYPVLSGSRLVGMLSFPRALEVPPDQRSSTLAKDIMSRSPLVAVVGGGGRDPHNRMQKNGLTKIPVVDNSGDRQALVGMLTVKDVVGAYELVIKRSREASAGRVLRRRTH